MTCPACGARTELFRGVSSHGFTLRWLACINPVCEKRAGFFSREEEITRDTFYQLQAFAAHQHQAQPEEGQSQARRRGSRHGGLTGRTEVTIFVTSNSIIAGTLRAKPIWR